MQLTARLQADLTSMLIGVIGGYDLEQIATPSAEEGAEELVEFGVFVPEGCPAAVGLVDGVGFDSGLEGCEVELAWAGAEVVGGLG